VLFNPACADALHRLDADSAGVNAAVCYLFSESRSIVFKRSRAYPFVLSGKRRLPFIRKLNARLPEDTSFFRLDFLSQCCVSQSPVLY
jgi:hypothetical protein